MRAKLQSGFLRWPAALVSGALVFLAMCLSWRAMIDAQINPLDAGQKIAFVAAAFSVTAYNLRTRVLDVIFKSDGSPSQVSRLCLMARDCGRKLTNLVIVFTLAALLLGAGGFVSKTTSGAQWYAAVVAAFFAISCVQFVYVLFAFERLERFMLDDAEERASKRESDRLLKTTSK